MQDSCFTSCEGKNNMCAERVYGKRPVQRRPSTAAAQKSGAKDALAKEHEPRRRPPNRKQAAAPEQRARHGAKRTESALDCLNRRSGDRRAILPGGRHRQRRLDRDRIAQRGNAGQPVSPRPLDCGAEQASIRRPSNGATCCCAWRRGRCWFRTAGRS